MRTDIGLEGVFRSVFPIHDFNKTATLEYVSYDIGKPKYDVDECIAKGLTFEAPLRIKVRLAVYDVDEASGSRTIHDIKEQDIYFGTIPIITQKGTFLINGTERVIVNQLQRSPGIIFEHDSGKTHSSRKILYSCRIIPMRGSWLDFDFDHKDILYVRIDRRRKMPATILLKAMGMTSEDILSYYYAKETFRLEGTSVLRRVEEYNFRKELAHADIVASDGTVIVAAGKALTKGMWKRMIKAGVEYYEVRPESLETEYAARDIVDPGTGEVLLRAGDPFVAGAVEKCLAAGITELGAIFRRAPKLPPACAIPWPWTSAKIWRAPRLTFTSACVPVLRLRPRFPPAFLTICSEIPTTMTCRLLDATSSTRAWG